jgi:hypothetical protein
LTDSSSNIFAKSEDRRPAVRVTVKVRYAPFAAHPARRLERRKHARRGDRAWNRAPAWTARPAQITRSLGSLS